MSSTSSRRAITLATAAALVLGLLAPAATAVPTPSPTGSGTTTDLGRVGGLELDGPLTLTLVTGDRVTLTGDPDGTTTAAVLVAPRESGPGVVVRELSGPDGSYLVPSDAVPLLADGVLDPALFEVGALAAATVAGGSGSLPVVLAFEDDVAPAVLDARAVALDGARPGVALTSVDAVAARIASPDAPAFWADLVREHADPTSALERVWLDHAVEVALDQTVPQVGADVAWEDGYDGTGTTIAVLDTGIDLDHPDFAGRIAATASFTAEGVEDGHGHGTHVASIAAGSGAASDGLYRGVAPGSELVIGKVIPSSGVGEMSAVIAGMEWAVAQDADVVSISISGPASDGTDLASQAVDALSAESDAIFVIASGNDYADAAVTSPATATSALAVGAVDKADALADYSNRGPRRGDAAVKPEITAPGTDVGAARADSGWFGTPIDDDYTRGSGTSMATPHVAGAAAIVAQQHPGWDGETIKDVLVSTAAPGAYSIFQGGAGRLDAAAAVRQGVHGTASADLGAILPPYEGERTHEIVYTNTTAADVTLALGATGRGWDGRDLSVGAVQLSADEVVVPAGGEATVTLSVDVAAGDPGAYAGMITATAAGIEVRTPFSWYKTTQALDLGVRLLDHRGDAAAGQVVYLVKVDAVDPNDPFVQPTAMAFSDAQGRASFTVTAGRYDVYGGASVWDVDSRQVSQMAVVDLAVDADTSVVLDGREAVEVNPVLPETGDVRAGKIAYLRAFGAAGLATSGALLSDQDWVAAVQPTGAVSDGWVEVAGQWTIASRPVSLVARPEGGAARALDPEYFSFYSAPRLQGERTLTARFAGAGTPAELEAAGVDGAAAVVAIEIPPGEPYPMSYAFLRAEQVAVDALAAGATAVITYVDEDGALAIEQQQSQQVAQLSVPVDQGRTLRTDLAAGPVELTITGELSPDRLYQLRFQDDATTLTGPPVVEDDDLLPIRSRYHADLDTSAQQLFSYAFTPAEESGSTAAVYGWSPARWTELVLRGEHLRWDRTITPTGWPDTYQPGVQLRSRAVYTGATEPFRERWNQGPLRSTAADVVEGSWPTVLCSACRHGDWFVPGLYTVDSTRRHWTRSNGSTAGYRLFRDGVEIPPQISTFRRFPLPDEPATLRLESTWTNPGNPDLNRLARKITTAWTFASEPLGDVGTPDGYTCPVTGETAGCAFEPLLEVDHRLRLGLGNEARLAEDGTHTFRVRVAPHSGVLDPSPLAGFALAYSVDGGGTWADATAELVRPRRGVHEVTVDASGSDGYVWLRTTASDAAGNAVTQTVERAFRVPTG